MLKLYIRLRGVLREHHAPIEFAIYEKESSSEFNGEKIKNYFFYFFWKLS